MFYAIYMVPNSVYQVVLWMFHNHIDFIAVFLVSTVWFNKSGYSVNESDGKVIITLYHSNPSSIDIVLKVKSNHVSTDSKC